MGESSQIPKTNARKKLSLLRFSLSPYPATIWGTLFGDSLMEKSRDVIRRSLKTVLAHRQISQAQFAKMAGRTDAWISDVLHGKAGMTLATLDQVLTVLKLDLVTFLTMAPSGDQNKAASLTYGVTPTDLESGLPSGTKEGADASPSLDPGVLEGRIAELERQLAAMRDVAITATTQNVAKRPERKTKPARKHSAGHRHGDRRLSR